MLLSLIIPVYNRPEEISELLGSLTRQSYREAYEIIIVEDGSTRTCEAVIDRYHYQLNNLKYITIPNGGPSRARNRGAQEAMGEYLLILDSDVVLPEGYLSSVAEGIRRTYADAFGGPDAAAPDFDDMQHAVSYAMTSWLTTGGIRGGNEGMEQFKPRSFNMGVKRSVFASLGGFAEDMRYGEDIDLSLRLIKSGASVRLFKDAFVYHKRRINLEQFFWQVHHSGQARIELEHRHPNSTKLVHYLPAVFTIGVVLCLLSIVGTAPLSLYALVLFVDAYSRLSSLRRATWAVLASFVQLLGYGSGFIRAKLTHP